MKSRRVWMLWLPPTFLLLLVLLFYAWFHQQVRQQNLNRALIQAIKQKEVPTAIALLNQGADANTTDKPIIPITLRSLLEDLQNRIKGIKPPADTASHRPALLLLYGAVSFCMPDTSIVDIDITGGDSPDWNSARPQVAPAIAPLVSALLSHGAKLRTEQRVGELLLSYACIRDDAATVKILLEHDVDPNNPGVFGFPPLMCTQDYECTRLLLEHGADVNQREANGRTRLMLVTNTKLYPLLFEHHADLNAQNKEGATALPHLYTSVYNTTDEIREGTRFLIQHGAKVSLKDHSGKTALDYARGGKTNFMVEGFSEQGYDKYLLALLSQTLRKERAAQALPGH